MSKVLSEVAKRNNFGFTFEHDGQIPPSSYESVRQANETVPGAVFTSFGSTGYRNRFVFTNIFLLISVFLLLFYDMKRKWRKNCLKSKSNRSR